MNYRADDADGNQVRSPPDSLAFGGEMELRNTLRKSIQDYGSIKRQSFSAKDVRLPEPGLYFILLIYSLESVGKNEHQKLSRSGSPSTQG